MNKSFFYTFIFLFAAAKSFAQIDFKPDTSKVNAQEIHYAEVAELPDFEKVQFEMRHWLSHHSFATHYVHFTYTTSGKWYVKTGKVDAKKKQLVPYELTPKLPASRMWKELSDFGILELTNQMDIPVKMKESGVPINRKGIYMFYHPGKNGLWINVELFSKKGYKTYEYYDPFGNAQKIKSWGIDDGEQHARMVKICDLLFEEFQYERRIQEDAANQ